MAIYLTRYKLKQLITKSGTSKKNAISLITKKTLTWNVLLAVEYETGQNLFKKTLYI